MPPEALAVPAATRWPTVPARWKGPLARLGLCWLALAAVFAADWLAMFDQWWNSSTYNHVLLVVPILGWLAWQRWPQVSSLTPTAWRWGLPVLAGAVLVWVLGAFSGFDLLRQAGAVAMLPASALILLGPRVFAAMLFPLCYMVFLVPFGDEMIPPLQTITARMTVALVHLSQIPATIDGVFIDTPAGLFEVAEACSGVKFLIAMIALGVLVGNVCFTSWRRRVAFFGLCVVVPILANGVRAWGTIFAAQYVGAEKAGGIDHLIYGWVFFAVVIAAVMALGWRFFDRPANAPMVDLAWIERSALFDRFERQTLPVSLALLMVALLPLAGIGWAAAADALTAPMPRHVDLPRVAGWRRVDYRPLAPWEPHAQGADHRLLGRYEDGSGNQVDVFYALYSAQGEGHEAGGFGQGALIPRSTWAWASAGPELAGARSDRLLAGGQIERLALTWYRTGSVLTGSNIELKLANIEDRLLLRPRATAMLIISAEARPGHDPAVALRSFMADIGDPGAWMDDIGKDR